MSQVNTNAIYDASGGQSAKLYGVSMRNGGTGWVNRIINGDMRIDQRNAGASVSADNSGVFGVDRFRTMVGSYNTVMSLQRVAEAPTGFTNSLKVTITTPGLPGSGGAVVVGQGVEGFNVADLGFGTAAAQTVTLSFWVRASVAGTYSAALQNYSEDRSFVSAYTINAANTWEYKTIVIVGDTAGVWPTSNEGAMRLIFNLGSNASLTTASPNTWLSGQRVALSSSVSITNTSGATWQVTGVQLEAGSVASPFERRDYGREFIMCQRYYWSNTSCIIDGLIRVSADTSRFTQVFFPVPMRAAPAITQVWDGGSSPSVNGVTPYSYRASVVQGDTTTARVITSVIASIEL